MAKELWRKKEGLAFSSAGKDAGPNWLVIAALVGLMLAWAHRPPTENTGF